MFMNIYMFKINNKDTRNMFPVSNKGTRTMTLKWKFF